MSGSQGSLASSSHPRWVDAVASFMPAVALTLLAAAGEHRAFLLGLLAAVPLYLVAAAISLGLPADGGYLPTLRRQLGTGVPRVMGFLLALAGLLYLPVQRLYAGGSLTVVLTGSAVVGLALVLLWRRAQNPALLLEKSAESVQARHRVLNEGAIPDGGAWLYAVSFVCLLLPPVILLCSPPLPDNVRWLVLLPYALLLAPALAMAMLHLSRRQLEAARERVADRLAAHATEVPKRRVKQSDAGLVAALYAATRAGQIDEALALLEEGANPHGMPASGARDQRTLLMLAAIQLDLRLLRRLIGLGVDLNYSHVGLTPLLAAVRDSYHGRPDAVLMLLANGADPCPADADGQTALHAAARAADPAIAALLLDAGAPIDALDIHGVSPLGTAAALGNTEVAKYLISRGADPEPHGGEPALLLASARDDDDPAMVKLLLRHKAHIDARGNRGRRALHAACLHGNPAIVAALLAAKAHPDPVDEEGTTPLMDAARAGAAECVKRLAARDGVDAAACDHAGRNALVIACQSGKCDTETVRTLLDMGVDPQVPANDGNRAIDHAVAAGRWDHVALLDPEYVLPACLADSDEDMQDVPPQMRLRLALGQHNYALAEALLPVAMTSPSELVELFLDLAPRLERRGAQVLADRLAPDATDARGSLLVSQLLTLGPAANASLQVMLERGASPTGRGGLARYLNAALLRADGTEESERMALVLLGCGADPFGCDADGNPPLIQALRLRWPRLLAHLLARGIDPEARDMYGSSALLLACQMDDESAVRALVRHGAQPSARISDGQTARGLALSLGHRHLSRWMDWSPWVLPRRPLLDTDLVSAAQQGDQHAVERLLELGLPLNAVDSQGCTALLRACGGGHVELVRYLLQRGADHTLTADSGATCLSVALTARQTEVVRVLAENGVDVDQRLPGRITPLMIAAALGQEGAIRALLANGADAMVTDAHGGGVLHALAQYGFVANDADTACAAWAILLEAGADSDSLNAVSETPLLLLLGSSFEPGTSCREDVILAQLELLLRHRVNIGARERRGFGALHLAAQHGLKQVVRRLIAAGADPQMRDVLNRRPADIALTRGFVDVAAEFDSPGPAPSIARFLREKDE